MKEISNKIKNKKLNNIVNKTDNKQINETENEIAKKTANKTTNDIINKTASKAVNKTANKIETIKKLIKNADCILIGAGAGLSTSAGIEYSGKRFTDNFADFIKKYHFTDMYTSSFYDFKTEEEKWAYWARHMYVNDIGIKAAKLYKDILNLIKNKNYFVITTNVDEQFYKANFDKDKIFEVQGSYRYIQCSKGCHNKLYDATELVKEMVSKTIDCKIPTKLVPVCPVCGEKMEPNLRKDAYFVQDNNWYKHSENYNKFIKDAVNKKTLLLELGVGFNTPGIIRFPFEQMTLQNEEWNLVRFNKDNCMIFLDIEDKTISVKDDINKVIEEMKK